MKAGETLKTVRKLDPHDHDVLILKYDLQDMGGAQRMAQGVVAL